MRKAEDRKLIVVRDYVSNYIADTTPKALVLPSRNKTIPR